MGYFNALSDLDTIYRVLSNGLVVISR